MKLSTHNLLMCNKKTCADSDKNFPLKIISTKSEENKVEFNQERIKIFYDKFIVFRKFFILIHHFQSNLTLILFLYY